MYKYYHYDDDYDDVVELRRWNPNMILYRTLVYYRYEQMRQDVIRYDNDIDADADNVYIYIYACVTKLHL